MYRSGARGRVSEQGECAVSGDLPAVSGDPPVVTRSNNGSQEGIQCVGGMDERNLRAL